LSSLGSLVREWCFSSGCALCGELLLGKEDALYGLCAECRKRLRIVPEERRASFGPSFSFFPYAGEYRTLMGAYKYGGNRNLGNFLAEVILKELPLFVDPSDIPECWIPVPPRPGKIKKTGWDQVAFLCRCLERFKGLWPGAGLRAFYLYPCLKRLPSRLQKELNREDRLHNLKGRIRLTRPVPRRVLLLDDVITTGATLEASAEALKEGGASEVIGLTLFYDP
jgi:ComF family protein